MHSLDRERCQPVVLVEQDLGRALSVANRVLCVLEGRIVLASATADVTGEQVTQAYFGVARANFDRRHPPRIGGDVNWVNAVVQGFFLGGLYALFACGLSLMFGVMRIINLAHGDIAVLGAFLVWEVTTG